MICEVCKKDRIDKILSDSKKAMKSYTKKLKEERICRTQANKKETDSREKL